jgi:hypothetical protein
VNVSGGVFGFGVSSYGSVINISGGSISGVSVSSGSEINLFGSNFVLDGVSLDDSLTLGDALTIDDRDVTFTCLLADGSAFSSDLGTLDLPGKSSFAHNATLTVTLVSPVPVLGDCNQNGFTDFLDITPFIGILASGVYLEEADCNEDGAVDFLDITPFVEILTGS